MKLHTLRAVAVSAGATAVMAVAACSTPSDHSGGPGTPGAAPRPVSDLNIGFFTTGSANPYAEALNDSTVSRARALGAKITELDSNFDVQTQVNQMQQAVARKTYNAWIVTLDDGVEECNQVKAAINAGIPVMVSVGHLCNDDEVGQVGFVGVQTPQAYAAWWKTILDQNPDAKTAFLAGPPLVDLVQTMKKKMDEAFGGHPQASLISYQNTDWTAQDGFKKTQDLLKAHPDVQVIASSYSLATRGVVQAVQQAGLAGKVKIYDMMGDQFIVDAIKSGVVTMTLPALPASEGKSAAENLVNHWTGKQAYKVYNPADDAPVTGGPYLTKQNAVGYTAQIPS